MSKKIIPEDERYTQEEREKNEGELFKMDNAIAKSLNKALNDARKENEKKPRMAKCTFCGKEEVSHAGLPFWEEMGNKLFKMDSYVCVDCV